MNAEDAERRRYLDPRSTKRHARLLNPLPDPPAGQAWDAKIATRKQARRSGRATTERRTKETSSRHVIAGLKTFSEVAECYVAANHASWRACKRHLWRNTLGTYAAPVLGKLPVVQVDVRAVMQVLVPFWRENPEAASRLRSRIESVLDYATAQGWRDGENPARWRGHLDKLLPAANSKVARVRGAKSLPWPEIGKFMAALQKQDVTSALALQFAILTATRTAEVLGLRWHEIDMNAAVWTLAPNRKVSGRLHRVPLSDAALALLRDAAKLRTNEATDSFVFPGGKEGKALSGMAMQMLLRRMRRGNLATQGFRGTFRDWCAEATSYPQDVAEAALGYSLHDNTNEEHQRGDLLETRRHLMAEWALFCSRF
jgi:integrase